LVSYLPLLLPGFFPFVLRLTATALLSRSSASRSLRTPLRARTCLAHIAPHLLRSPLVACAPFLHLYFRCHALRSCSFLRSSPTPLLPCSPAFVLHSRIALSPFLCRSALHIFQRICTLRAAAAARCASSPSLYTVLAAWFGTCIWLPRATVPAAVQRLRTTPSTHACVLASRSPWFSSAVLFTTCCLVLPASLLSLQTALSAHQHHLLDVSTAYAQRFIAGTSLARFMRYCCTGSRHRMLLAHTIFTRGLPLLDIPAGRSASAFIFVLFPSATPLTAIIFSLYSCHTRIQFILRFPSACRLYIALWLDMVSPAPTHYLASASATFSACWLLSTCLPSSVFMGLYVAFLAFTSFPLSPTPPVPLAAVSFASMNSSLPLGCLSTLLTRILIPLPVFSPCPSCFLLAGLPLCLLGFTLLAHSQHMFLPLATLGRFLLSPTTSTLSALTHLLPSHWAARYPSHLLPHLSYPCPLSSPTNSFYTFTSRSCLAFMYLPHLSPSAPEILHLALFTSPMHVPLMLLILFWFTPLWIHLLPTSFSHVPPALPLVLPLSVVISHLCFTSSFYLLIHYLPGFLFLLTTFLFPRFSGSALSLLHGSSPTRVLPSSCSSRSRFHRLRTAGSASHSAVPLSFSYYCRSRSSWFTSAHLSSLPGHFACCLHLLYDARLPGACLSSFLRFIPAPAVFCLRFSPHTAWISHSPPLSAFCSLLRCMLLLRLTKYADRLARLTTWFRLFLSPAPFRHFLFWIYSFSGYRTPRFLPRSSSPFHASLYNVLPIIPLVV